MSESNDTTSAPRSRRRTLLVWGALLTLVIALFYMEKIPPLLHWPFRLLFVAAVVLLVVALFQAVRRTRFNGKKVAFSLILAGILYGALFVICLLFVNLMAARDERLAQVKTGALTEKARRVIGKLIEGNHPALFDADVGWVPRPDYEWKVHTHGKQGLRGQREYAETPSDPEKRILCIGDSFTFGYEVEDDQTYPHHGEQLRPGTEWINLGICGTGLAQSLQQYRKNGRKFGGNHVVIGFMTNNAKRTVNSFRGFVSPEDITPYAKPFAKLDGETVSIEPNPYQSLDDYRKLLDNESEELRRLYDLDYLSWSNQRATTNPIVRTLRYVWERRNGDRNVAVLLNRKIDSDYRKFRKDHDPYGPSIWHPESLGFKANARTFDLYHEEVLADGRVPLIVILPSAGDVENRIEGRPSKHAAMVAHFREKGYRHIDFIDVIEDVHGDKLTPELCYVRTHFNGATNKLLAEEIIKALSL